MNFKKLALSTFLASSIGAASFAGTLTEPEIMEVDEVPAAAGSSSGGIILPLLALVVVAALVASDSDSETEELSPR